MRGTALAHKQNPKYDGRCRRLSEDDKKKRRAEKQPFVLRFQVNSQDNADFVDCIHGTMSFAADLIEDFVIIKSTGGPTYNFAAVIDDHLMGITHVIRGDDHLSNTPRQVLLYRSLGLELPQFAHLPMILGADGERLSKRHGATSLSQYKNAGYLAEALVNYLALLGWSTTDSQQLFAREDLIEKFSLERCSKSASIFDGQKLLWMNGEYIRHLDPALFFQRSLPWLKDSGLYHEGDDLAYVQKAVALCQEKVKRLDEIPFHLDFMLKEKVQYKKEAVAQWLNADGKNIIQGLLPVLKETADFSASGLEQVIKAYAKSKGFKNAQVFHPLRVAVSGRTEGPSLFHMLELLGKDRVLARMQQYA
jgi:glutamyl-tRNA synthetase